MYIEQKYKNWAQDIKHSKNIAGSIIYLIIYLVKKKPWIFWKQNKGSRVLDIARKASEFPCSYFI